MLNLPRHSLALLQRLKPLRDSLAAIGIPVSYLPPEAGKFGTLEEAGYIEVTLPAVQSSAASKSPGVAYWEGMMTNPIQEVRYAVNVEVSLKTLYNEQAIARPTVETVVDEICSLLCGFRTQPDTSELSLSSYSLKEPEGDRWIAILGFYFLARVEPQPPEPEPEQQQIELRLYNSLVPDASDAVQVKTIPQPII